MVNNPEAPKFLVKMTFESNTAFFVAIFILITGVAWSLRDHRRRQMEIYREDSEDQLYISVLIGMFIVCVGGAYWIFRRQRLNREYEGSGHLVPIDTLVNSQVDKIMENVYGSQRAAIIEDVEDQDFVYFLYGLGLTTIVLVLGWVLTRTPKKTKIVQKGGQGGSESVKTQSIKL